MDLLKKFVGLDGASVIKPAELVKFLLLNVGGRIAAVVTVVMATLFWFAPLFPESLQWFAQRGLWSCGAYLLAIMFWRQSRNQQMMAKTLAAATIADPTSTNTSRDPAVQREIDQQIAEKP